MISKHTEEQIKEASSTNFLSVIHELVDLKHTGKDYKGNCPFCNGIKKLSIEPRKEIYKCFVCGAGGKGLISFVQNKFSKSYPETLEYLANRFNIIIEHEKKAGNGATNKTPFRDLQLKASGLTLEDQKTEIFIDNETQKEIDVYQTGTVDDRWNICHGDDMLLHYFDLEGKPVTFTAKGKAKAQNYFRIRYQLPENHRGKDGKARKYSQPFDSGNHPWLNKWIRNMYKAGASIEKLFIQEGEKKTDKATKHGIASVGISGINNLGRYNVLPKEFELIVKKCNVKEVAFVVDSDWLDLGNSTDQPADHRAKTFLAAIRNFREYFYAFHNIGIYLETFIVAINKNEANEKGIDDLLSGSLSGKEAELKADIDTAMIAKDGKGKHVTAYKITGKSEYQLRELFHTHTPQAFFKFHEAKLKERKLFKYNNIEWHYNTEARAFELAAPITDDEKFWSESVNAQGNTFCKFSYTQSFNFLKARNFGRLPVQGNKFRLVRIENKIVHECEAYMVKDYIINFAKSINEPEVVEMLYRGAKMYLGPDSLSNMDYISTQFVQNEKNCQYLFFKNQFIKITDSEIKSAPITDLTGHVWSNKIINFAPDFTPGQLLSVEKITPEKINSLEPGAREHWQNYLGQYSLDVTAKGDACHFLKFLINTSDFHHEKTTLTDAERFEINIHTLSKLTAIGYLLHQYRDPSILKAVVAMDGKISAVGESHGRTGKSLLGNALEQMVPTVYIPGKRKDLTEDKFIWGDVDERTQMIWIDDIRVNFDFEFLFPVITGKLQVEAKGLQKNSLPKGCYPKLYIPTNHAINGEGGSFSGRQALIAFSDYYYYRSEDDNRQPVDDFGVLFFDEWDFNQWNLFYELMATCLQLYFKHGIVSPPSENLELRKLRQHIGEQFMDWADLFFQKEISAELGRPEAAMGQRLERKYLYNDFISEYPNSKKYIDTRDFKKRLILYCRYKNLIFNPTKPKDNKPHGGDDKSGGIEYFTVTDQL